ncbi:phage antirepressor N-terminal domain-containing protein, partial [Mannheimia haemolytica]|uniref:phage antirepressor N-terminal domain-containing protein n=1 Tax=Mannheimia haemolytica TaxID=75985 RepID=UPI0011980C79
CWDGQRQRIQRDEVLSMGTVIITVPTTSGDQQMICLPIEYLNGWLFGIDVNRCKPEIRATLIKYKKECYQALHDYWFKGKAERSQIAPIVEPKIPMELTKKEWLCFASMWFALYNSLEVLATLEKQLRTISS